MPGRHHKLLRIALIACAILCGIVVAMQIVLNSSPVRGKVDSLTSSLFDGGLEYKDCHFSVFPGLKFTIDSLSLTYPHEHYSSYPPRNDFERAGSGAVTDTLVSAARLVLRVSPLKIMRGRIAVEKLSLRGLSVYAHSYASDCANWQILSSSTDTSVTSLSIPPIDVRDFSIEEGSELVYSNRSTDLGAKLSIDNFSLGGLLKLSDSVFTVRKTHLSAESLASLSVKDMPVFDIPIGIETKISLRGRGGTLTLRVPWLDASLGHVPLNADGEVRIRPDSTFVRADVSIDSLDVQTLIREYGLAFSDILPYVRTDAKLCFDLKAQGHMPKGKLPPMEASLTVPRHSISYPPKSVAGSLALGCKLTTDSGHNLNARIDSLFLDFPGALLNVSGNVRNLTSGNPAISAGVSLTAVMDRLTHDFLHDAGIDAAGKIELSATADAHLSDFDKMHFKDAEVTGHITSDRLAIALQGDTLSLDAFKPDIDLSSGPSGLGVHIVTDSAYARLGSKIAARGRQMDCDLHLMKMPVRDSLVPGSVLKIKAVQLFAMTGVHKVGVRDANVDIVSKKKIEETSHVRTWPHHHRNVPDSIWRKYSYDARGFPVGPSGRTIPPPDDRVIKIRLDSALISSFHSYDAWGNVQIGKGFVATPVFPLRTRVDGIKLAFTPDSFRIDKFSVRSGTSDIKIKGRIGGLERYQKKRGILAADLDINSRRLNVNEIVAAIQYSSRAPSDTTVNGEADESFVHDDLADSRPVGHNGAGPSSRRVFLPSLVNAKVNLNASSVNFSEFNLRPFRIKAQLRNRVLQVCDAYSDLGIAKVKLNGYYSTRGLGDISAGVDASISDASAQGLLKMLPSFDSLMPPLRSFEGILGCEISATARLDDSLNVNMSTLEGMTRISGKGLKISDAGDLRRFTKLLMFKNRDIGSIDDMEVSAVAHNGSLEVFPFILNVDRYKLALQGVQGFDRKIDYYISVLKSPFLIPFGLKFYGSLDKWKVHLGPSKYPSQDIPVFSTQLDSVKLNVAESIKDIYSGGFEEVQRYNARSQAGLEKAKLRDGYSSSDVSAPLSEAEKASLDSLPVNVRTAGTDSLSSVHFDVDRLEREIRKTRLKSGKH